MKMKCLYVAMVAISVLFTSCHTAKEAVNANDLDGEWNVTEINGQAVKAESQPFIGFDAQNGRVYGYTGCNRLMGALTLSKPNKIELGQMASTLMACPDMENERLILNALASVKSLKCSGKTLELYGADKEPVMLLQKRFEVVPLSSLQGEWHVVNLYGAALPEGMETVPALNFDVTANRVTGNSGCNRLSGAINHDEADENSISFGHVASTRMACPDMDTENQVLSALNSVRSYGLLDNGRLALMNESGTIVLELERSK